MSAPGQTEVEAARSDAENWRQQLIRCRARAEQAEAENERWRTAFAEMNAILRVEGVDEFPIPVFTPRAASRPVEET